MNGLSYLLTLGIVFFSLEGLTGQKAPEAKEVAFQVINQIFEVAESSGLAIEMQETRDSGIIAQAFLREAKYPTIRFNPDRISENYSPTDWKTIFVFAHEFGHLALGHTNYKAIPPFSHSAELEADAFAARCLCRLGATDLLKALEFLAGLPKDFSTAKHPAREERIKAFSGAWQEAGCPKSEKSRVGFVIRIGENYKFPVEEKINSGGIDKSLTIDLNEANTELDIEHKIGSNFTTHALNGKLSIIVTEGSKEVILDNLRSADQFIKILVEQDEYGSDQSKTLSQVGRFIIKSSESNNISSIEFASNPFRRSSESNILKLTILVDVEKFPDLQGKLELSDLVIKSGIYKVNNVAK